MTEEPKDRRTMQELVDLVQQKRYAERGEVIVYAALLDDFLMVLLIGVCVHNPTVARKVFGEAGPLGTFGSRIDMAYLLGLIADSERRLLHAIRKIRNEFGHSAQPRSFQTEPIKGKCLNLTAYPQVFEKITKTKFDSDDPEHRFRSAMLFLTLAIGRRYDSVTRLVEAKAVTEASLISDATTNPDKPRL